MQIVKEKVEHDRQRASAQPRRQPLHAVVDSPVLSMRHSSLSAGSTEPSVPSVARSAAERRWSFHLALLPQRPRQRPQPGAGAAEVRCSSRLKTMRCSSSLSAASAIASGGS
eukprot:scaffold115598_cov60-Phaeocystis_antarctica.AAC.5